MRRGVLWADNVAFTYAGGLHAIDGVSFRVGAGESVAIVGRNGAGKSTLLRLLNGLLAPSSGSIAVNGKRTSQTPVHVLAREIGTLFQAPEQQIFNARVDHEIGYGPRRLGLTGSALKTRVASVLERVGLQADAARHPLDLDAAALRFVALGSVLAMRPPILLLDEPQRGLDARALARLEAILSAEAAAGTTIVAVCHDMDFVARRAQRVIALAAGRVVADASTLGFFSDAALTQAAGVEIPDPLGLARVLGLAPALTPEQLAAHWIAHIGGPLKT